MFGNLAALSWYISHFNPSFQPFISSAAGNKGQSNRSAKWSAIVHRMGEFLALYYRLSDISEPRLHHFPDRPQICCSFQHEFTLSRRDKCGAELIFLMV